MSTSGTPTEIEEAVLLGAQDAIAFGDFFFPKTVRQSTPWFHRNIAEAMCHSLNRFEVLEIFRGGAKTTRSRLCLAHRLSYGNSRTTLIIGKSEGHAFYTGQWLKRQVETNELWAGVFGLEKGSKWSDEMFCIKNTALGQECWYVQMGVFGSTRGINLDDYRPDFILCDDLQDDENSQTAEQRAKIGEAFHGAIRNSLAPASEAPHAKMVLLGTPFNKYDLLQDCKKSPLFNCQTVSCFDANGESNWPERFPTEVLLNDKADFILRRKIHIWLREMECVTESPEDSAFRVEDLSYYTQAPKNGYVYIGIDPTPPPRQEVARERKRDSFVIRAVRVTSSGVYLLEKFSAQAPMKEVWLAALFEIVIKYRTELRWCAIETVLFARLIADAVRSEMIIKNIYFPIKEVEKDKRPKRIRIEQELSGLASNKRLYVRESDVEFIEQFTMYPRVAHDDELDAATIALASVTDAELVPDLAERQEEQSEIPRRMERQSRGAP